MSSAVKPLRPATANALRVRFVENLVPKLEALRGFLANIREGDFSKASAVRRLAHQLRGTGSAFGWPEITAAAEAVDLARDSELQACTGELVAVLTAVVRAGSSPRKSRVLLVLAEAATRRAIKEKLADSSRIFDAAATVADARCLLADEQYDLAVLDLILPDADGRQLLSRLQERVQTAGVPVFVLSTRANRALKTECLALGAEQFFEKPLDLEVFAAAATNTLTRQRRHAQETRTDPLTGLANRAALQEEYARAAALAHRRCAPLSLAMIDLDHLKLFNDRWGHAAGDAAIGLLAKHLARKLRGSEVSGRWGGDEFVVIFPDTEPAGAVKALRKIQSRLAGARVRVAKLEDIPAVTLSGGVAAAKPGDTLDDALAEADRLLYAAKALGRGRILDAFPSELSQPRVLFADDDPNMSAIVCATLNRGGFAVQHVPTGVDADRILAERPFDLVILDKRMPGRDGFDVLAGVRKNGRNRSTPVIMVTAVGSEPEIERAFELGADDYVQKPFPPRELLARARRLLKRAAGAR